MTEDGGQMTEDGRRRAEDRCRKSDVGRQRRLNSEVGIGTRRRPVRRDCAAAKDAEDKKRRRRHMHAI